MLTKESSLGEAEESDLGKSDAPSDSVKPQGQIALFFVFDVESIGLHGDAFAVAGGLYCDNGAALWEFAYSCPTQECDGEPEDREWVLMNCPELGITHRHPKPMRQAFWEQWMKARKGGALMAADCSWPVEAAFLENCIKDESPARNWDGPYPLIDIGSVLLGAGMDPMKDYERTASELPKHDPLADARQSARLLSEALGKRVLCGNVTESDEGSYSKEKEVD